MKKLNVIYFCLIFVLLVSMCSCGARKVNKEHSKEEIKSEVKYNSVIEKQSETNVKTTITTITDDKNETVTEETVYKPEDSTKEAFVIEKDGTKTVLNNITKTVKKTTKKNNTKTETANNIQEVKKEAVKETKDIKQVNASKKENSSKQVKKEAFNWFNLLWLLIPIGIIYYFYRRYTKLI